MSETIPSFLTFAELQAALDRGDDPPEWVLIGSQEWFSTAKAAEYVDRPPHWPYQRKKTLEAKIITYRGSLRVVYFPRHKLDWWKEQQQEKRRAAESPDPDLISFEVAAALVDSSRSALYRLVDKKLLHQHEVQVYDQDAKRWRKGSRINRRELLGVFVECPQPGQPIRVRDGTPPTDKEFWLRDDAKEKFECSDTVLSNWAKKRSRLHPGPALEERQFYVRVQRDQSERKLRKAWNGEHLKLIIEGNEGKLRKAGRGLWAQQQLQQQLRENLKTVLDGLKPHLPKSGTLAMRQVKSQIELSSRTTYDALPPAGIKILSFARKGWARGRGSIWYTGSKPPTAEQIAAAESEAANLGAQYNHHQSPLKVSNGYGTDGGRASNSGSGRTGVAEEPFVPTAFQERILAALNKKAMKADALQSALWVDRKRLYREGLNPLMQAGLVRNNRRVGGYYRPDAPPPKYAEFLG
jgi:hypothetical protein